MRLLTFLVAASLLSVACAASNDDAAESTGSDLSDLKKKAKPDAGVGGTDAGSGDSDGTPTRRACTSKFGSGLAGANHRRLDGTLVAIVPAGQKTCSGDSGHDHLQILMDGDVYDVAVNVESIYCTQTNAPLVGGGWEEGWHPGMQL